MRELLSRETIQAMRTTIAAAAFIAGCYRPMTSPTQGSTTPVGHDFYCSATRQCFTVQADCGQGDCMRLDHAWCAVYGDSTAERLVCGVERDDCNVLLDALRTSTDHGQCVKRKAVR